MNEQLLFRCPYCLRKGVGIVEERMDISKAEVTGLNCGPHRTVEDLLRDVDLEVVTTGGDRTISVMYSCKACEQVVSYTRDDMRRMLLVIAAEVRGFKGEPVPEEDSSSSTGES